jgi:ribonucleoside-diphosphate reductase alpha chain
MSTSFALNETTSSHSANTPHTLQVIKRNGQISTYQGSKIAIAITKAILAIEGQSASGSTRIKERVDYLVNDITRRFRQHYPTGSSIHIEAIQDQVELALMRQGMQKVARAYVLYREEHARKRESETKDTPIIMVNHEDGTTTPLDMDRINQLMKTACDGLADVEADKLMRLAQQSFYNGIKEKDISTQLIMAAKSLIESEPNYSYVSARLLLKELNASASQFLLGTSIKNSAEPPSTYSQLFCAAVEKGISLELLSPDLARFDLNTLGSALKSERDFLFTYLGLQTLYDRYLLHWRETRFELPQIFFMRVAMGLALNEDAPNDRAIEFYNLLSTFDYMCSTPTLFNSGTRRSQLSSCYLTTVPDSLDGIYDALKDNALLSKWAGGLGNDWTPVRALGTQIKGTNGQSQGVVPFLKVVNDTAVAVNQGGKRKGAVCAYLECWHLDVEDFLDLRKNTGDERRRAHDMNSANWIPDLFMKRVFEEKSWTLFSPSDVPDLHDLYGQAFEDRYDYYEQLADRGEIKLTKKIPAIDLWRKMLSMIFETGHPWITFKDPCNIRSPQQHAGVIHSSNLCTEITLNTSEEEIAVCNLGSINLSNHIHKGELNSEQLKKTINTAIRMLDNVIDINYYAVPQARESNLRHRPIGMGVMGFQDALYQLEIPYNSVEAVQFADQSMELISYYALETSAKLAEERGQYVSYPGSLWDKGILPIDSLNLLREHRGDTYTVTDDSSQLDWQPIRELIKRHGLRNSNVMAIAPTATISNIVGVCQSIEPTYQNLYVKSNLSGEFTMVNPWLVKSLKTLGIWDDVMVNDLKYYDGSLRDIERIPDEIKARFVTAFEIDSRWLIEAAARRQKWIDQAQSLNLYMAQPSGKLLDNLYKTAWTRGLKTTYYLRSLGATHMEKLASEKPMAEQISSQIVSADSHSGEEFDLGNPTETPNFCSILDPDCEACQ